MSFVFEEQNNLIEQCEKFLKLSLTEQKEAFKVLNEKEQFQTWDTTCAYHISDSVERFEEGKPIDEKLSNAVTDVGNLFYNLGLDIESDEITPSDDDKTELIQKEIGRVFGLIEKVETISAELSEE